MIKKIGFIVIGGILVAGIVNAAIGNYYKTVDDFIPRVTETRSLGDSTHLFLKLWTKDLSVSGLGGFGDTTPEAVLEVTTSSEASAYFMVSSDEDGDGDYLIVDGDGNVGIGNDLSLEFGDLVSEQNPDGADAIRIKATASDVDVVIGSSVGYFSVYNISDNAVFYVDDRGDTVITGELATTGKGTFGSLVVDSPTLVVNASGYTNKVGIGTATPSQSLEIVGNIELENTVRGNIAGVIYKGGISFIHDYEDLTGVVTVGQNLFIGRNAGNFTMGGTAINAYESSRNVGIGRDTLKDNAKGFSNVAIGVNALTANTDGKQNFGMGYSATQRNTIGSFNIGIGTLSLQYNINGDKNVAIGSSAGRGAEGNSHNKNTLIGYQAGRSITTGSSNIIFGNDAGFRQTTNSNLFIIDNLQRASTAVEATNSIVYGTMGATPSVQSLRINAQVSANEKSGMSRIGGFMVKLTNKTGVDSVAGKLVQTDTTTNDAVKLTGTDEEECMGIFLDSGVPDGSEAWIIVSGIADVAMEDNTTATRGNWVRSSITEAGYADATNATPPSPAAFTHFNEIGNCIETVTATGEGTHILARCVLHFN